MQLELCRWTLMWDGQTGDLFTLTPLSLKLFHRISFTLSVPLSAYLSLLLLQTHTHTHTHIHTHTHNNCLLHRLIHAHTCTHTLQSILAHIKVQGAHPLWGPLFKVSVNGRIKVTMLFFSPSCSLPLNWILTTLSSWPGKVIYCHYLRIMIKQKSSVTINMVFLHYFTLFPHSHST